MSEILQSPVGGERIVPFSLSLEWRAKEFVERLQGRQEERGVKLSPHIVDSLVSIASRLLQFSPEERTVFSSVLKKTTMVALIEEGRRAFEGRFGKPVAEPDEKEQAVIPKSPKKVGWRRIVPSHWARVGIPIFLTVNAVGSFLTACSGGNFSDLSPEEQTKIIATLQAGLEEVEDVLQQPTPTVVPTATLLEQGKFAYENFVARHYFPLANIDNENVRLIAAYRPNWAFVLESDGSINPENKRTLEGQLGVSISDDRYEAIAQDANKLIPFLEELERQGKIKHEVVEFYRRQVQAPRQVVPVSTPSPTPMGVAPETIRQAEQTVQLRLLRDQQQISGKGFRVLVREELKRLGYGA